MSAPFLGLEWTRPAGAAALALPLLVWLLHRARARPPEVATGTLALWRALCAQGVKRAERTRRAVPPRLWLLIAGLALGALALAGPRQPPRAAARTWRLVVDRSPSMYLPVGVDGGATRLRRALDSALELLAGERAAGDELLWICAGEAAAEERAGERPPADWLVAPRAPRAEPQWELHDRPGTLWITDRAPAVARAQAGLCASGGGAQGGLVARTRDEAIEWDGERLAAVAARAPRPRVVLAPALPVELRELGAIWAAERGLDVAGVVEVVDVVDGEASDVVLRGLAPSAAEAAQAAPFALGRDGWSAAGRAAAAGAPVLDGQGPLETWLAGGRPLVTFAAGRLHCAILSFERLEGDPAAFALSWAGLLDRACLPPPGAVSVAERSAAGPALSAAPMGPPPPSGSQRPPLALAAWLALAALLLSAAALAPLAR